MALLIHLLMGTCASWLLVGLLKLMGRPPAAKLIASFCLLTAFIFSMYGVWNAFHPRIRSLGVEIDHLPDHWHNKTIVQISDVHLGHIFRPKFLDRVGEKIKSCNPELIVITGDLFDGMNRKLERFIRPLNRLSAPKGVYFVLGNHENYMGINPALEVIHKTHIVVLDNEVREVDGIQLVGVSYPGVDDWQQIRGLTSIDAVGDQRPTRILLFHTPTSIKPNRKGNRHSNTYWFPDTRFPMNKAIGIDLQLSGHTHDGQLFPFNLLSNYLFKGYSYGFHQDNGFAIYISSGVGAWGPPIRTGSSSEIVAIRLKKKSGTP